MMLYEVQIHVHIIDYPSAGLVLITRKKGVLLTTLFIVRNAALGQWGK